MIRDQHIFQRTAAQIANACEAAVGHHNVRIGHLDSERGGTPEEIAHNATVAVGRKAFHGVEAQKFAALAKLYREQPPETLYPLHGDHMAFFGLDGSPRED